MFGTGMRVAFCYGMISWHEALPRGEECPKRPFWMRNTVYACCCVCAEEPQSLCDIGLSIGSNWLFGSIGEALSWCGKARFARPGRRIESHDCIIGWLAAYYVMVRKTRVFAADCACSANTRFSRGWRWMDMQRWRPFCINMQKIGWWRGGRKTGCCTDCAVCFMFMCETCVIGAECGWCGVSVCTDAGLAG